MHQPGFFHLLKPYLFYNNRCEFVSEPVRPSHLQPSLAKFARQLYESVDAIRFVQDRDLAFVLYQAILRPQVSRIGGAYFRKKFSRDVTRELAAKLSRRWPVQRRVRRDWVLVPDNSRSEWISPFEKEPNAKHESAVAVHLGRKASIL